MTITLTCLEMQGLGTTDNPAVSQDSTSWTTPASQGLWAGYVLSNSLTLSLITDMQTSSGSNPQSTSFHPADSAPCLLQSPPQRTLTNRPQTPCSAASSVTLAESISSSVPLNSSNIGQRRSSHWTTLEILGWQQCCSLRYFEENLATARICTRPNSYYPGSYISSFDSSAVIAPPTPQPVNYRPLNTASDNSLFKNGDDQHPSIPAYPGAGWSPYQYAGYVPDFSSVNMFTGKRFTSRPSEAAKRTHEHLENDEEVHEQVSKRQKTQLMKRLVEAETLDAILQHPSVLNRWDYDGYKFLARSQPHSSTDRHCYHANENRDEHEAIPKPYDTEYDAEGSESVAGSQHVDEEALEVMDDSDHEDSVDVPMSSTMAFAIAHCRQPLLELSVNDLVSAQENTHHDSELDGNWEPDDEYAGQEPIVTVREERDASLTSFNEDSDKENQDL